MFYSLHFKYNIVFVDDLNIALKKAKKAEYFDDLSSSYGETIPDKRRIKRNKKYRTSESSYASSEDDLNFPSVPKTMGKRQSEGRYFFYVYVSLRKAFQIVK